MSAISFDGNRDSPYFDFSFKQQLLHYGIPKEAVESLSEERDLQKLLSILNGLKDRILGVEAISILICLFAKIIEREQTASHPEKKERFFTLDEEIARNIYPLPKPPSMLQLFLLQLLPVPEDKLLVLLLCLDRLKSYTRKT